MDLWIAAEVALFLPLLGLSVFFFQFRDRPLLPRSAAIGPSPPLEASARAFGGGTAIPPAPAYCDDLGRHYLVGARIELKRLRTELGLDLPAGSYQSLASFLMEITEAIPRSGTVIEHKGISFSSERGSAACIQETRIAW